MKENTNDLPIGFSMSLSMNQKAMEYYSTLPYNIQNNIVSYIQNNKTGFEAKEKVRTAINSLKNNNIDFLK